MEKECVCISIIERAHGSHGREIVEVAHVEFIIGDPPGTVVVNAATTPLVFGKKQLPHMTPN
jgi:hypothetical protein